MRHRKLERLRQAGTDPYPVGVERSHTLGEVQAEFPELAAGARSGKSVTVAGRVLLTRDHGGVLFAVLRDWSGDLQIALTRTAAAANRWTASARTSTSATTSTPTARSARATAVS